MLRGGVWCKEDCPLVEFNVRTFKVLMDEVYLLEAIESYASCRVSQF